MTKAILIAYLNKADEREFEKIFKKTDYHLIFSESEDDVLLQMKLFKPDLIIAGKGQKEKGHIELCEAVKTDSELKFIPFILLSESQEEISAKDRNRLKMDGTLTKPLREEEVLPLVQQLMGEEVQKVKEQEASKREMEWKAFGDHLKPPPTKPSSINKEELFLDGFDDMEEEIIELVDVVEEPEPRASIRDFVTPREEEPIGEITPLELWGKREEEIKPLEKEFKLPPLEKEIEKGLPPLKREVFSEKVLPKDDLFEKIELDEILQKLDQLTPSSQLSSFDTFEAALQKQDITQPPSGEMTPGFFEMPKEPTPQEVFPTLQPVEASKEAPDEEFPAELLEELGEEEIRFIEAPQGLMVQETKPRGIEPFDSKGIETVLAQGKTVERQMEEGISKRVREMMEDVTLKLVPEVTQTIINLTLDRVEKVVREVVPDIAEKAIHEEIKRLQKGEKD
jgi:CheY-like chemotaxis protein